MVLRVAAQCHGCHGRRVARVRAWGFVKIGHLRSLGSDQTSLVLQTDMMPWGHILGLLPLLCDWGAAFPQPSGDGLHTFQVHALSWLGTTIVTAKPPDAFATWWPRWMTQSSERLDQLVRRGGSPDLMMAKLRAAFRSRGHADYLNFAEGVGADIVATTARPQLCEASAGLEEDINAWVLYTEEAMLIEFLEAHFPMCMRRLWEHISEGGLFADHLSVTETMFEEGVLDFYNIRQWNEVLSSMLPDARVPRQGEHRWLQVLEQWLWDTKDELSQLLEAGWDGLSLLRGFLGRAGLRGSAQFSELAQNMVDRLTEALELGEGPVAPLTHAAWAVGTETKLYALFLQHGGAGTTSQGSSSSAARPPETQEAAAGGSNGTAVHLVVPPTHAGELEEDDVLTLMDRKGVNKKWLKSRSRSRSRGRGHSAKGSGRDHGPPHPKGPPPRAKARVTRETVDLSKCVRPRSTPASSSGPPRRNSSGAASSSSGGSPGAGLTLPDAVQLWLLWLGITDENNQGPSDRLLPVFVEEVVTQSFLSFNVPDRLTLSLGFTQLVQMLMSAVGALIEQACRTETAGNNNRGGDETVSVEVEVESDETHLMQRGPPENDWLGLLHQLRVALEQQSKVALYQNIQWFKRLLHHRCVNSAAGQLLGLLQGRAGDLTALLAAAEMDAAEVQDHQIPACSLWCREWWEKLKEHLEVAKGSLEALGRPPLNQEPLPALHTRPLSCRPARTFCESVESSEDPPQPELGALSCQHPRPEVSDSPSEAELLALAEEAEACEAQQLAREAEEEQENTYYENLYEAHRSAAARDWDDWAMHDEMHRKGFKRRRVLRVDVGAGNGTSSARVQVPLSSDGTGEIRLQVAVETVTDSEAETVAVVPVMGPEASRSSTWNNVGGLAAGTLQDLYVRWRAGLVSSHEVSSTWGPAVLDALQVEHLAYLDGGVFYDATKGAGGLDSTESTVPDVDEGD